MRPDQMALSLPVEPAYGRDDFILAACNRDAAAWIDTWPDWPIGGLVLYGPPGSGKTHLAAAWAQAAQATWIDGPALTEASVPRFLGQGHLVVDRADEIQAPRPLLHLLNGAREAGAAVVMTARAAPARWAVTLPDLSSRLKALSAVPMAEPDEALMSAILVKLFADRQVRVSEDLVQFLLTRLDRSVAVLRTAVETIDAAALAAGRRITIPFIREVLGPEAPADAGPPEDR